MFATMFSTMFATMITKRGKNQFTKIVILKVYNMGWQKYREKKIRVWDKNSIPLKREWV